MNPNDTTKSDDQIKMGPLPYGNVDSQAIPMTSDPLPAIGDISEKPASVDIGDLSPKRKLNKKIIVGALALLAFVIAGGVVALQSSGSFLAQNQDTRSRAACTPCGGNTCPDGWSYGPDGCWLGGSCDKRHEEACRGHQGGSQPQQQQPAAQQQSTSCTCDGHTACGAQADNHQNCRKYLCNNGSWQDIGAANSGPCTGGGSAPAATTAPAATQAPASSGGSSSSTSCASGWQCGANCATSSVVSSFNSIWCDGKGRWLYEAGCGGSASALKSTGCGAGTGGTTTGSTSTGSTSSSGSTSGACTNGQTRCRNNAAGVPEFNDVCINGQWTAGGNACTPTTGGQAPAAGCVGGVSCPISYCNDNQDVPPDSCYKGGSCADRTRSVCASHGGAQGGMGGTSINTSSGGTTSSSSYTPGAGSGKGTIGDACVPNKNDCGYSGNVELGCNYCGAAIGYKCTAGGSVNKVEVGCSNPGTVVTNFPSGCDGLGAFQIRCLNDGTYRGQICTPVQTQSTSKGSDNPSGNYPALGENANTGPTAAMVNTSQWQLSTVIADACGATCQNGGIQQSSNGNRCSGPAGPNSIVTDSGFLGCGNVVTGGNGDKCSNCYRISGKVTCIREGSSCGAKTECANQPGAPVATAPNTTTAPTSAPQTSTSTGGGGTTTTTVTEAAGMCVAVKLWVKDSEGAWVTLAFNQAAGKVKVGDTVRLSTSGSGRVFTQGRFRIKVDNGEFGAWQTTSTKDKGEYYINYVIPSLSLFTVESQVF